MSIHYFTKIIQKKINLIIKETYLLKTSDNTIATASFKTDSPKRSASKFGSTFKSLKTAKTVTGSVAEIMAPN